MDQKMSGTDVAIVGGGLSGLALADHLHRAGVGFQLFEARDRFGGRIKTSEVRTGAYDLGPAWFWPGQPKIAALIARLDLTVFEQFAEGRLLYETETGQVKADMGYSSMQGSLRLDGGMATLVRGLMDRLPADRLHLNHAAKSVQRDIGITFSNGATFAANTMVLAMPPRLSSGLTFAPHLGSGMIDTLQQVPSWMGGHAKLVAIYDTPFWRRAGCSGNAMSRRGPMVEIHDATPRDPYDAGALFGFLGIPPDSRRNQKDAVIQACITQLVRIFGPKAANPRNVLYKDWAAAPFTSSALDLAPLTHHPAYGLPPEFDTIWGSGLLFCGTETAHEMGGYLEGALVAAEHTARRVIIAASPK